MFHNINIKRIYYSQDDTHVNNSGGKKKDFKFDPKEKIKTKPIVSINKLDIKYDKFTPGKINPVTPIYIQLLRQICEYYTLWYVESNETTNEKKYYTILAIQNKIEPKTVWPYLVKKYNDKIILDNNEEMFPFFLSTGIHTSEVKHPIDSFIDYRQYCYNFKRFMDYKNMTLFRQLPAFLIPDDNLNLYKEPKYTNIINEDNDDILDNNINHYEILTNLNNRNTTYYSNISEKIKHKFQQLRTKVISEIFQEPKWIDVTINAENLINKFINRWIEKNRTFVIFDYPIMKDDFKTYCVSTQIHL